jgi:hypothetical protein
VKSFRFAHAADQLLEQADRVAHQARLLAEQALSADRLTVFRLPAEA